MDPSQALHDGDERAGAENTNFHWLLAESFLRKPNQIVTTLRWAVINLLEYIFLGDVKPIEFKGDSIEPISLISFFLEIHSQL